MRGRFDGHATQLHTRFDSLLFRLRSLAGGPAALSLAFLTGLLTERLRSTCTSSGNAVRSTGLLSGASGLLSALQTAFEILGPKVDQ